jgi:ribosome recycling factor
MKMNDLEKSIFEKLENKMLQAQEVMLSKFTNIRTGIANPKILDKITVDYYNEKMPLKNISTISVLDGNQINIKPFDNTIIGEISKAILNSDLGITPQDDGQVVKLVFPKPTEDRRKILIKEVDKIVEQTKISIRNIIRQGKKTKLNEVDTLEDNFSKDIQNLNNKFIKLVEADTIKKKNELLKI